MEKTFFPFQETKQTNEIRLTGTKPIFFTQTRWHVQQKNAYLLAPSAPLMIREIYSRMEKPDLHVIIDNGLRTESGRYDLVVDLMRW